MNATVSPEYARWLSKLARMPASEQVAEWRGLFWTLAGRSHMTDKEIRDLLKRQAERIEVGGQ